MFKKWLSVCLDNDQGINRVVETYGGKQQPDEEV